MRNRTGWEDNMGAKGKAELGKVAKAWAAVWGQMSQQTAPVLQLRVGNC